MANFGAQKCAIIKNGECRKKVNIEERSLGFAIRIVKLKDYLVKEIKEYELAKQILKSGTGIGANIAEAQQAQSKADFLSKMNIALKECTETKYWLRVLKGSKKLTEHEFESVYNECVEIEKILSAIVKTTKSRLEK